MKNGIQFITVDMFIKHILMKALYFFQKFNPWKPTPKIISQKKGIQEKSV